MQIKGKAENPEQEWEIPFQGNSWCTSTRICKGKKKKNDSINGHKHVQSFTDGYSPERFVYFLKMKTDPLKETQTFPTVAPLFGKVFMKRFSSLFKKKWQISIETILQRLVSVYYLISVWLLIPTYLWQFAVSRHGAEQMLTGKKKRSDSSKKKQNFGPLLMHLNMTGETLIPNFAGYDTFVGYCLFFLFNLMQKRFRNKIIKIRQMWKHK